MTSPSPLSNDDARLPSKNQQMWHEPNQHFRRSQPIQRICGMEERHPSPTPLSDDSDEEIREKADAEVTNEGISVL